MIQSLKTPTKADANAPKKMFKKQNCIATEVEQTWGLFTTKLVKYFD